MDRIYSDPVRIPEPDPDPNEHENQDPDPDPNKVGSDPQHCQEQYGLHLFLLTMS